MLASAIGGQRGSFGKGLWQAKSSGKQKGTGRCRGAREQVRQSPPGYGQSVSPRGRRLRSQQISIKGTAQLGQGAKEESSKEDEGKSAPELRPPLYEALGSSTCKEREDDDDSAWEC